MNDTDIPRDRQAEKVWRRFQRAAEQLHTAAELAEGVHQGCPQVKEAGYLVDLLQDLALTMEAAVTALIDFLGGHQAEEKQES